MNLLQRQSRSVRVFDAELAAQVGLNQAIFLSQLNYWIEVNISQGRNLHDGHHWAFNTYEAWIETNFQFWSVSTLRRVISDLAKRGIIVIGNYNKKKYDKTKWYRINHDHLDLQVEPFVDLSSRSKPTVQNEQSVPGPTVQNEQMDLSKMNRPIPETNSETNNTETTPPKKSKLYPYDWVGIKHRKMSPETIALIVQFMDTGTLPKEAKKKPLFMRMYETHLEKGGARATFT